MTTGIDAYIQRIVIEFEKTNLDALLKGAPEIGMHYRVLLPTGEIRWLEALGKVEYAADGRPLRMSGITLNITERKRAEESQRQEHRELETILAAIPAAVMITKDASCTEMTGNPAAYDLLERPAGANLSKSAPYGQAPHNFEIFQRGCRLAPADLPIRKASACKCAISGEELELRFVDGQSKFLLGNALPLLDGEGEVRGAVASFADITKLKRTEAALRESEERLKFALEAAGAGAWEVALETGKFIASDRALALHALPLGTVVTHERALACKHPEDRPRIEAAFRHTLETGEPFRLETRVPLPDGSMRWLESSGELRSVCGKRVIVGLVHDITERKRAEIALRESEELLRSIIEHVPVPILLSREDREILLINPALTKLAGYTAADLPTRDEWEAFAYRENAQGIKGEIHDVFERGVPTDRGELWIYTKSGDRRLWSIRTAPAGRDASGKRLMVSVGLDITERKRSEDALASALRLEAVGKLAGGVAHDFNNLLAVIAGNLELAEDRIHDETVRDLIRRALNAAEKGAGLNRRLLSLARRRILKPQRVILNRRVEETAALLKSTLGEDIELTMDLAADLWATSADPGEIDSAVLNVAANARDAMPNGGKIRISTTNVTLGKGLAAKLHSGARAEDYVRLAVADDGAGMTEEVLGKAMEPFFTTKGLGAGTGLGLASVASFARQTGGFAVLESGPGHGCIVSLYLPRCLDDHALAPDSHGDQLPLGDGELVLVVEDDDEVREVTLKRIESLGYAVVEARTGLEAVQRLESREPVQLVLSDIVMPGGMTGYDLARWVALNMPKTQVILCSGYNEEESRGDVSSSVRAVTVLGKPYNRDQLARALSGALTPPK